MPETNDGPPEELTGIDATPTAENPLPGFAEAMVGHPANVSDGEPDSAAAVDAKAVVEDPKAKAETPAKESAKAEENPDATKAVNFDGLSDATKTYWENALKAGHATPADVERARVESLFQSAWSKRNNAKDDEVKAIKSKYAQHDEDLKLLARIRADEKLLARWDRMSKDEPAGEPAGEEEDTWKRVERIAEAKADQRIKAREVEEASRSAKERDDYAAKQGEIQTAVRDQMRLLGVTQEVMMGYLKAEEAKLPVGTDPILHFTPEELQDKVSQRHEKAVLEAKVAALEAQVQQRASKAVQTSKQSLPPISRVSENGRRTPVAALNADLSLAPDWSNVQGFGNPGR